MHHICNSITTILNNYLIFNNYFKMLLQPAIGASIKRLLIFKLPMYKGLSKSCWFFIKFFVMWYNFT